MTVLVDDPLIATMAIKRTLPLHESSRRLRELYPECPRAYGVAVMGDLSRRRWWPLAEALTSDRLRAMFELASEETDSRDAVAQQLTATLAHVVLGRVIPLVVLEGRAWDTGLENLWVHVDSEGAIDWVGVIDPTLRALPDDPFFDDHTTVRIGLSVRDGIVALPSEAALTTWVAHRSHRALDPLFARQQRGDIHRVDVAHRRCRGRQRRDAVATSGRVERADQHAARPGGAGRSRRIRCAGPRKQQDADGKGLAKLGQPCLFLLAVETCTTGPRRSPEGCRDSRSTRRTGLTPSCVRPVRISGFTRLRAVSIAAAHYSASSSQPPPGAGSSPGV